MFLYRKKKKVFAVFFPHSYDDVWFCFDSNNWKICEINWRFFLNVKRNRCAFFEYLKIKNIQRTKIKTCGDKKIFIIIQWCYVESEWMRKTLWNLFDFICLLLIFCYQQMQITCNLKENHGMKSYLCLCFFHELIYCINKWFFPSSFPLIKT